MPRPNPACYRAHMRGLPMTQDPKLNSHSKFELYPCLFAAEKRPAPTRVLMLDIHGFVNTTNALIFHRPAGGGLDQHWRTTHEWDHPSEVSICVAPTTSPVSSGTIRWSTPYGCREAILDGTFGAKPRRDESMVARSARRNGACDQKTTRIVTRPLS